MVRTNNRSGSPRDRSAVMIVGFFGFAFMARRRSDNTFQLQRAPMTQDSSDYWKKSRVELPAAGFDPDRAAQTSAVVTIASAWTNAHRCNNRVRGIADLLVEVLPSAAAKA